jgi:glutamyl-tRNA synthetase
MIRMHLREVVGGIGLFSIFLWLYRIWQAGQAMSVRVRFAPSPTGPLHMGGVRTALYNYLFARKHGGQFLLRIEDTDQRACARGGGLHPESAGLVWHDPDESPWTGGPDGPYRQSDRKDLYKQYADQLIATDKAYYAFDTSEELDAMRERLKAAGSHPRLTTP